MIDSGQRGHKDDFAGSNELDHVRGLCLVAKADVSSTLEDWTCMGGWFEKALAAVSRSPWSVRVPTLWC